MSKKEVKYAYEVEYGFMWFRVRITRYEYVSHTEKTMTVKDEWGRPRRSGMATREHKWFLDPKEAKAYALERIKHERERLKRFKASLDEDYQDVKAGKGRAVNPVDEATLKRIAKKGIKL
ncbi:MAG: hypothetical protein ACN6OP_20915 [Pseudomonadales bacterium]